MKEPIEQRSKSKLFGAALIALTSLILILLIVLLITVLSKGKEPTTSAKDDNAQEAFLPIDDRQAAPDEQNAPEVLKEEDPPALQKTLLFTSNGDGTCRLSGLGGCTDACVIVPERSPAGDLVTEIDAEAFFGKSGISAIQISSTVQKIGARAFADCRDLLTISVSRENRSFCDLEGTLYTKDKTVLIQYPAMRAAGSVKIPIEVREILDMAFYNCPYLSKIYYPGSAADWEEIRIGEKNYALSAAAKQFRSDGTGK